MAKNSFIKLPLAIIGTTLESFIQMQTEGKMFKGLEITGKWPSINDVSSEGEGGGQKLPILLSKKLTKGEGGGGS